MKNDNQTKIIIKINLNLNSNRVKKIQQSNRKPSSILKSVYNT